MLCTGAICTGTISKPWFENRMLPIMQRMSIVKLPPIQKGCRARTESQRLLRVYGFEHPDGFVDEFLSALG